MFQKISKTKSGYTIIETMVAISIFVVVVVFGTNTLLNANLVSRKSHDMRSIMDNLNFIMEDISRNARTGYDYECYYDPVFTPVGGNVNTPRSCDFGTTLVFEETHGNPAARGDQWVYRIYTSDGGLTYNIDKSVDYGATFVTLNPPEIVLKAGSGFSILGAEHPSVNVGTDNRQQPLLNIHLVGEIKYKNTVTPFALQTSVSQRLIDVKF